MMYQLVKVVEQVEKHAKVVTDGPDITFSLVEVEAPEPESDATGS